MKRTVLMLALAALTGSAVAADLLDTVKQRGTLKIALEGTYPPFNFKDSTQQLTGFEVELGNALAKRLNVKPEFVTGEWSGLLAGLQSGKFDVVMNQVSITDKRKEVFDFSQPYTVSSAQLIVRKNETRSFRNLDDLKGKKLGVGQGSNYADMAKAVSGIEVKTYPGAPEYLQDLATGRIDAALNDSLLIPFAIKEAKLPLKAGSPVGGTTEMGIPFAKNNPKFKAALDKALTDLKADGTFRKISVKWFGIDVSRTPAAKK
ncbi:MULTISPECIES: cystine ABC transporter substrate-binding protein [Gulbenkiania]|uniref:Amino acid ABC transporter substrate-binding protein, PAAT family (TC 3.A.1.3.-) n=2 Tax=Gulbenkiania TaxID=397456 RepID=A0A0K6GSK2_9NEIS|nr:MULTISPECIES: cystine ABC transporter substrate-binding protein [Gulbenkiania]TCW32468.1 cystine transport system substrate-binding protein [Gulbenkiania mobilis]CUA81729.1 amino acid ABC transporter substrate-binding protein, PAAT family (TC 3.A.1.3.-) [Gulbenkiania indica]